jgi:uncharacterized Tic20 family protein
MENIKEEITNEEKILSLFSHLSMMIGGIILPIVFWAINKDKSKFVRFHSLQSIFYHLAFSFILAFVILIFAFIIAIAGVGFGSMKYNQHSTGMPAAFMIFVFIFIGIFFLAIFAGIGYSIYLAIKSYQGEKTRIPIIGKIVYEKVYGKGNS